MENASKRAHTELMPNTQTDLTERYQAAVKAVDMAHLAYRAAATLEEIDAAYQNALLADRELDGIQRMLQAHNAKLPYPKYKGD